MKIVRFQGGLGNQLFQYAFYKRLLTECGNDIYADLSFYNNVDQHNGFELEELFEIELNKATVNQIRSLKRNELSLFGKILTKLRGQKRTFVQELEEDKFKFNKQYLECANDFYLDGYWQSHLYFSEFKTDLLENDFKFKKKLNEKSLGLAKKLSLGGYTSIHVRRGDYVNHPNFGGICEADYYQKAIDLIRTKKENLKFVLFSDDPEWCKSNLELQNALIVSWNSGADSWMDMALMSYCDNNIIANSSFSYWGAILNRNSEKIVIGPSRWKNNMDGLRELYPKTWIAI